MKRNEFKYPQILASLIHGGIGSRKARRMVKNASFVNHKHGEEVADTTCIAAFCIWADQGKYSHSWREASDAYLKA